MAQLDSPNDFCLVENQAGQFLSECPHALTPARRGSYILQYLVVELLLRLPCLGASWSYSLGHQICTKNGSKFVFGFTYVRLKMHRKTDLSKVWPKAGKSGPRGPKVPDFSYFPCFLDDQKTCKNMTRQNLVFWRKYRTIRFWSLLFSHRLLVRISCFSVFFPERLLDVIF